MFKSQKQTNKPPWKKNPKTKRLIAFSACTWRSYRLLWRAAWRPPPPSPRSCPPRQRWRRRSSRGPGWCPPWPEPGRSLVVPPARRSHSACRHSAPGPLTHNWSVGSWGQRRGWVAGEGEQRRAWKKEILTFASALACVQREKEGSCHGDCRDHYLDAHTCQKLPSFTVRCSKGTVQVYCPLHSCATRPKWKHLPHSALFSAWGKTIEKNKINIIKKKKRKTRPGTWPLLNLQTVSFVLEQAKYSRFGGKKKQLVSCFSLLRAETDEPFSVYSLSFMYVHYV